MDCILAKQVDTNELESFLESNITINRESLLNYGYIVRQRNQIIGCFELEMIDESHCWLKQLHITQNEVFKLPALLEYILVFAKSEGIKVLHAHSEQPMTDLLLSTLRFTIQPMQIEKLKQIATGKWWSYKVS